MDARKSPSSPRKDSPPNTSHKTLKQRVDRLDSTVTALPLAFTEYLEAFGSFCLAGIKLASLLETFFQDTPVLTIALRFREACELLGDKCSKSSLFLKQELVPPVRRFGPTLGVLRSRVETHAKVLSKHESYLKQLECLKSSQNPNRTKVEQVEEKFQNSALDFAKEDSKLAESLNEVSTMRIEVMGSCFLSFLETQSKLLTSASDIMGPLGAYKEVGKGLNDSPSNSTVKEATVGWLAAAQINHNLRSFGALSRNDVQCMMYNQGDNLPDTIRNGLNHKVDSLLKTYGLELTRSPHPHYKVLGGFHLNPKGVEMAMRDCCTELEARGAGAAHAQTRSEKVEQVSRDVPRTSYRIHGVDFGCAMGDQLDNNIRQKQDAISALVQSLPVCTQPPGVSKERIKEFAFHVLNESCTTVTNTAAKTTVQLVFGKANLVLVRPSSSAKDNRPIKINPRSADSSIQIVVESSWWLVEDYAAFSMLFRQMDPNAVLGVVDATYTIHLTLTNFLKEDSRPELPHIAVTYRQGVESAPPTAPSPNKKLHTINRAFMSLLRKSSHSKSHDLISRSPKPASFHSYVDKDEDTKRAGRGSPFEKGPTHSNTDKPTPPSSRNTSSGDSDALEVSTSSTAPQLPHVPTYTTTRSDSLSRSTTSRPPGPTYHLHHPLRRRGSNESMSSQSTLVRREEPYDDLDPSYGIMDMIGSELGRGQLTESRINAHMQLEARKHGGGYHRRGEEYEEGDSFVGGKPPRRRRRDQRIGQLVVTPEHEGSGQNDLHHRGDTMSVSPSSDTTAQVHIASDTEVQNVIDFLSNSVYSPDPQHSAEVETAGERSERASGGYPTAGSYRGERAPPTSSDNSSSGSSGIGTEGQFREGRDPVRSRSTSMSPVGPADVERNGLGSTDSGINVTAQQSRHRSRDRSYDVGGRISKDEAEAQERSKKRKSKEVLDFSGGFGPITNPVVGGDRFDLLGESVDYKMMGLDFFKTMSDDESEHSARLSIPPLSSPSSGGSQSPLVRTRSAENISSVERPSSRVSTHSMPYVDMGGRGSTTSLEGEVNFNHAPGGYVPPRRARPYSDYEYDDRLSQDSVDGSGRGSLSQGSHDNHTEWEWGHHEVRGRPHPMPPPHRDGYPMDYGRPPYDYGGPPPPPRGQGPPYDSPHMHEQRQSRPMHQHPMVNRDDYSPSPGPHGYDRGFRPPPMMGGPGPGGPPPWGGGNYDPNFDPQRMRGGPPPPPGPPMGGHHPPPMPDRNFRPVPFRSTTPSDAPSPASMPSMSPAPSPRPTPPPTPPPNPNFMGHHGPPLPGPHPRPHPQHMQGPMGPMGPPRMRPPPPHHGRQWEGPPPRDFPPPPRGMMGPPGPCLPPPPMGHSPGPHMPPGPLPHMPPGPLPRYPNHPPEWSDRPPW
ncbi:uncharacterized protein LOC135345540 isoform X2 [Halichondria panicea]|uniref:uncharacterized protein LOC135345540 isoform X2 n=1 Tax=Halichondria panicea TaxID=6063 RepID=UPI00312BB785